MAKIQNISEIHSTLGFTEFDIQERYCKSFHESEFGGLHSVFPFECVAKATGLSSNPTIQLIQVSCWKDISNSSLPKVSNIGL